MQKRWMAVLVLAFALVAASSGYAQEKGQVGVTMAFPASMGIVWHASDNFALRPDFTFQSGSTDNSVNPSTSNNRAVGAGIAAIFYVARWENLRAYVSPRFGYGRNTSASSTTSTSLTTGQTATASVENVGNAYSGSGSVGAHYFLGRRFAVFAEIGFGYSRLRSTTTYASSQPVFTNDSASATSRSWATRSGIGGAVYF